VKTLTFLTAMATVCLVAAPAAALTLTPDTGWSDDLLVFPSGPTVGSPIDFTVDVASSFKLTDCCVAGDTYRLFSSGSLLATSSYYGGAPLPQYSGNSFYEAFWESPAYSKIDYLIGPGTYSFIVVGDGAAGVPASLGLRVDTVVTAAVPEPSTWAMMIGGFGLIGGTLRRRAPKLSSAI